MGPLKRALPPVVANPEQSLAYIFKHPYTHPWTKDTRRDLHIMAVSTADFSTNSLLSFYMKNKDCSFYICQILESSIHKKPWALFIQHPRYSWGALHSALCPWPNKTGISGSTLACIQSCVLVLVSLLFECSDSPLDISSFTPSSLCLGNSSRNLAFCPGMYLQTSQTGITMWQFTNEEVQNTIQAVYQHVWFGFFTSRMKNLAVFTFDQVFFSLETGLMFISARREKEEKRAMDKSRVSFFISDSWWLEAVLTNDCHQRIKIPYVKALSGNINEEFNDLCSLFLFCRLQVKINKYL